jgi:hypothetical protein
MIRILPLLILLSSSLFASEITWTTEEKLEMSDVTAVATIESLSLGPIRRFDGFSEKRQQVKIDLRISKLLLGQASNQVTVVAYSTFYEDDNGAHMSTAGFSTSWVTPAQEYLVYLRKRPRNYIFGPDQYEFAADSNQFVERIYRQSNEIQANGQNIDRVGLPSRLGEIAALASAPEATIQQDAPGNPE